jgi:hypothetical protein
MNPGHETAHVAHASGSRWLDLTLAFTIPTRWFESPPAAGLGAH